MSTIDSVPVKILTDEVEYIPILDFSNYRDTIIELIRYTDPRFTLGIYGEWGTGKTTLMKSIEKKLNEDKDIVTIWFNAWRYEREEQLTIVSLLKTIAYQMGEHSRFKSLKPVILKSILTVGKGLVGKGLVAKHLLTEKTVEEIQGNASSSKLRALSRYERETIYFDGIRNIQHTLDNIITKHPKTKVVVFIDDLDRCSPTRTLEVFESLKVFLDINGFIYIMGLNYETISKLVTAAYKESGISGELYIRKLIQIPIVIPEWNENDIHVLIENLSSKVGTKYSKIIRENKETIARGAELNPREVKRFINNFIVANEVYKFTDSKKQKELLVIQALRIRWPHIFKILSSEDKFRQIIKDITQGKTPSERERKFNYHKGYILKEQEEILSRYISNMELWPFWDFLDEESDTIFNISDWNAYRRAIGGTLDYSSFKIRFETLYGDIRNNLAHKYIEYMGESEFKETMERFMEYYRNRQAHSSTEDVGK